MAYPHGMPAHELTAYEEDRYEQRRLARIKFNLHEEPYVDKHGVLVMDTLIDITNTASPVGGEYVAGPTVHA